jgi:DnaJ-domain-containing protein 1
VEKLASAKYVSFVDGLPLKRPKGRKPVTFSRLTDAMVAIEDFLVDGTFTAPHRLEHLYNTYAPETEGYGNPDQWRAVFAQLWGLMGADEPYEVLGLSAASTWDEIKSAYRKLASSTHPDHGGSAEAFCRVREAFEILKSRKEAT